MHKESFGIRSMIQQVMTILSLMDTGLMLWSNMYNQGVGPFLSVLNIMFVQKYKAAPLLLISLTVCGLAGGNIT